MPKRIDGGLALLADPTRRRIIALIAREVRQPSRIALEIGLSRPAVSRQLGLLWEAGLIDARRYPGDGRSISYHLNREMAAPIVAWLAGTEVGLTHGGRVVGSRLALVPVQTDLLRVTAQVRQQPQSSTPELDDGSG